MFEKIAFRWPPQPSTVIGLEILAGTVCYFVTGDPAWAGVAAAAVKILVPDNSAAAAGQVLEVIKILAEALGRPLPALLQQAPVVSSDRGSNPASLGRELPKE
jgi:hypothetical protein